MKTTDYEFLWFTEKYGTGFDTWRELAATWIKSKDYGVDASVRAITNFFEKYLTPNFIIDPTDLFSGEYQDYREFLSKYELADSYRIRLNNEICDFIDWVILTYYSEPDDNGDAIPLVKHPFKRHKNAPHKVETVFNALPFTYIKQLRKILCPVESGNFCDWSWAIESVDSFLENGRHIRDWMIVEESLIDKNDPDCVWRKITLTKPRKIRIDGVLKTYKAGETIFLIWSPVNAMVLFTKLHLPLRTYQVRMLDSGEADTWRYTRGSWEKNEKHAFAEGSEKRPWKKGVFNRIITPDIGDVLTGLYISTNKTADRNKDETNRGYVIPWQHDVLLYWLEKLRNWQEKYNKISERTSIHDLEYRHFGGTKTKKQRDEIGDMCFLFRHASAEKESHRAMPIKEHYVNTLWAQLMAQLEHDIYKSGKRLPSGEKIRFIDPSNERKTRFPLHSLRVSLITCYSLEGEIPAPVLSKLLVGHSRLIMTMHYHKITPTMMAKKFKAAENKINEKEDESLEIFLQHESVENIVLKSACHNIESIQTVLRVRNPAGWQEKSIGICLAGGNTSPIEKGSNLAGCYNGGQIIVGAKANASAVYGPVPHGIENCIRCRWFITDVRYIYSLTAHFNNLSFHATEAANIAAKLEYELDSLLDEQYFCEEKGELFTKHDQINVLERRIDKQKNEADEYCKDLVACFQIIRKIKQLEENRITGDKSDKVVALGSETDIAPFFSFTETESEFRQLIQICSEAEIFTDLRDDLLKSSAIAHRSNTLNTMLTKTGYMPFLMQLDDETQLLAGNAMCEAMLKATKKPTQNAAMDHLASYIDTEKYLQEAGLVEVGIKAIETKTGINILRLSDISKQQKRLNHG